MKDIADLINDQLNTLRDLKPKMVKLGITNITLYRPTVSHDGGDIIRDFAISLIFNDKCPLPLNETRTIMLDPGVLIKDQYDDDFMEVTELWADLQEHPYYKELQDLLNQEIHSYYYSVAEGNGELDDEQCFDTYEYMGELTPASISEQLERINL